MYNNFVQGEVGAFYMTDKKFIEQMECTGIIPVIKLEKIENAVRLAGALYDGGIRAAEVTFRAEGADRVISAMTAAYPDMLIGAGTVLTTAQVDASIRAGAKFCVAPGLNPKVVKHCLDQGVPFVPGVANGSQIEQAMELGLDFVKFFPAEQAGGVAYIKAISAPYFSMKFMPTGGVNEANLNTYLANPKIVCCGGSWIVPDALVKAEDWAGITNLCRAAVRKMLDFRLVHIGINSNGEEDAAKTARVFERLFGWQVKVGNSSVFAGKEVECMKQNGRGVHGHIAVSTGNIKRAVAQLEMQGIEFDHDSFKYDTNGRITVAYLKDQVAGFAIHLVENK